MLLTYKVYSVAGDKRIASVAKRARIYQVNPVLDAIEIYMRMPEKHKITMLFYRLAY